MISEIKRLSYLLGDLHEARRRLSGDLAEGLDAQAQDGLTAELAEVRCAIARYECLLTAAKHERQALDDKANERRRDE